MVGFVLESFARFRKSGKMTDEMLEQRLDEGLLTQKEFDELLAIKPEEKTDGDN